MRFFTNMACFLFFHNYNHLVGMRQVSAAAMRCAAVRPYMNDRKTKVSSWYI